MKMTPENVRAIATLARLEIDADQAVTLAAQMDDILGYMEKLNALDTTGIAPMYSPLEHAGTLRMDEVRQEFPRKDILRNAPDNNGEYFVVPRIV